MTEWCRDGEEKAECIRLLEEDFLIFFVPGIAIAVLLEGTRAIRSCNRLKETTS